MKSIHRILTIATLSFLAPSVSLAAITCTPSTCDTITHTVSNGQNTVAVIPAGVPTVSFYAQGGSSKFVVTTGGGGGGACAYTGSWGYIVCVGGAGGGGWYDTPGGSTAGSGVGLGGFAYYGGAGTHLAGLDGIRNGSGGSGGPLYTLTWAHPGQGGAPGYGGGVSPEKIIHSGGGGGGGAIYSSISFGANSYYYVYALGGYLLGGGDSYNAGGPYGGGGGGGGGYGGGGAGGIPSAIGIGYYGILTSGGGGSSYFHPSLSAPDADGYVSIPVSVIGQTVLLFSGTGGVNRSYKNIRADGGTITLKYLCSPENNKPCSSASANSCGDVSYGTYDCSETCIDYTGQPIGAPAERPPVSCTLSNVCGQTSTGTVACNGDCVGTPPPDPVGFGTSCNEGVTNSCGDPNPGIITCSGCSASGPPPERPNYGSSCSLTSLPNDCGKTVTVAGSGTIGCDSFTCTGTPPPPPPNSTCAPTAPTINALYKSGSFRGPSVLGYDPLGYQLYAQSVSPANYDLTYYFEWSKDGINWTGDPSPPSGSWATLP